MKNPGKWIVMFVAVISMVVVTAGCNCEHKAAEKSGEEQATTNEKPAPPKDHPAH